LKPLPIIAVPSLIEKQIVTSKALKPKPLTYSKRANTARAMRPTAGENVYATQNKG
jgi:hypothetical protein